MKNVLPVSLLCWAACLLCFLGCAVAVNADDSTKAKAKSKARAALELEATARVEAVAVKAVEAPAKAAAFQVAKAAFAECCAEKACKCPACECDLCDCSKGNAKPMPPAKSAEKLKPEKLSYADLEKAVAKLKAGESFAVYVGQPPPESASGRVVALTDSIPMEEQRVGVFKFFRGESGAFQYETMQPKTGGTRITMEEQAIVGNRLVSTTRYYDRYPDGSLYWCVPCNRGR